MRQHDDSSDTFSGVTLAYREPIAHCSCCGQSTWYEIPTGTKSSNVGGLRWYSLECPHCKSGCMAVANNDGPLTESQAALVIYGKGGVR
jgi:hypothetical protein